MIIAPGQFLTESDTIVLTNLLGNINTRTNTDKTTSASTSNDDATIETLSGMAQGTDPNFEPTIFTSWDRRDFTNKYSTQMLKHYAALVTPMVRSPTDVVFFTHLAIYTCTLLPSALYLYHNFTYAHGILHYIGQSLCAGAFTILLHNHIHNSGVLSKPLYVFDMAFPYILGPLMGHTWNSYYYHHVKHHHVEGNGPEDLSSTIRYQRDSLRDFLQYELRFLCGVWIELPIYFIRKGQYSQAARMMASEWSSLVIIMLLTKWYTKPTMFVLTLPLVQMRIGMMVGNWGQHAFVDDVEPTSDFRSSITLIDTPSNRYCFNDGYHTSHHLNPRRHWRDHPSAFIKSKQRYASEGALVFQNIDYLMITIRLMKQDYDTLADCLVPMGDQIGMDKKEIKAMLRSKCRRFTEEDIKRKFRK